MTCFFIDSFESRMNPRFLAESEKGMFWQPRVIESGRKMVEGLTEDEKGKKRASVLLSFNLSWFSVIHVFMSSVHALCSLVRLVTSLIRADFWSCVSSAKRWRFTEWLAMISERGVVYRTKRTGHSTEPWGTPYLGCDGEEDELLTEVDWYLSERFDWNHWSARNRIQAGEENLVVNTVKSCRKIQQKRTEMVLLSRAEKISFTIRNETVSVLCSDWQADWKGLLGLFSWR